MDISVKAKYRQLKSPKVWKNQGEKFFYDPYREKKIKLTPEEVIRQKTVQFLIKELGVPASCIRLEQSMRHYQVDSQIRADIVVEGQNKKKNEINPLAVIECKAEYVALTERAQWQVMDYADNMGCDYIFLTNGWTMRVGKWVEEKKNYLWLEKIPTYQEMCKGKYVPVKTEEPFVRAPFGEWDKAIEECYQYNEFGKDTPKKMLPFLINFWQCLLDVSHALPKRQYRLFELLEDWETRELSFGNPSGGIFNGIYRSFLIEYKKRKIVVSFHFSRYSTYNHIDIAQTALCIGIEDGSYTHHALQLNMDRDLLCHGNRFKVTHSGRIAIGNMGSGKIADLKKMLERCYPDILIDNTIVLGTLTNDRLFYLDDQDVVELMENFISYALIRDELRKRKADGIR